MRRSEPGVSGVRRRAGRARLRRAVRQPVELFWTLPEYKAFFEQLATFCRVVLFDKAGVGLSDPVPQVRTLDDRAAEIEAVMDAVGFGKGRPLRSQRGRPGRIVFAATRPERTRALILTARIRSTTRVGRHRSRRGRDAGAHPSELGEDYTPSTEQIARLQEFGRAVRSAWGSGAALSIAAVGPVDAPARECSSA